MALDIQRAIGAVTREVVSREIDGKPATVLVAERSYDTTPDDLWDAVTNPERLPRWFLPISGDLELGGRYQLEGNAGGEIQACDRPRHLRVTWEWSGDVSWVEVTLTADDAGGTRLRLEHVAHLNEELWDEYGPGATGVGWDLSLLALQEYLSDSPALAPENTDEWALSDEGREFSRQSSEGWGDASIAYGTEPEAAHAAARRTTSAYTGAEVEEGDDPASGA